MKRSATCSTHRISEQFLTVEVNALTEDVVIVGPSLTLCDVYFIIESWIMDRKLIGIHAYDWT